MKRSLECFALVTMLASAAPGSAIEAVEKANGTQKFMVRPEAQITAKCPAASKGKPVTIRFKNIAMKPNGNIVLKRNIRQYNSDSMTEVDESEINGIILPVLNNALTPLDIVVGNAMSKNDRIRIKIVIENGGIGAKFIGDGITGGQLDSIMTAKGQENKFCDLSPIKSTSSGPAGTAITFSILSGEEAGFAIGIIVPEVDAQGVKTGRSLPIYIDPIIKNEG